jgi:hypothetical protein
MMLEEMENVGKDKDLGWDTVTLKEEFGPIIRSEK